MAVEWESKHLRLYLRALGFDRTAGIRGLQPRKDIFCNRSNSGFHAIVLFLFTKLDPARAAETFRGCHFLVGGFTNPEFRKKCCKWLKEILKEHRGCFPQITPSALMVPAGPKFIHLLYQFARRVVVENMKINSVGTDIPFAEAVELMPKDTYMANARCRVAYNKLLQILQKEDFVIQEYEKKAQSLIEEINQIQSEYTALQIQFYKMKQNDQNKNNRTERIQKVCIGNVYEAEKLNFLTVIQLLNEALRILRDEHCQAELKQEIQVTERKIMLHRKALLSLQANRIKVEQQHCVLSESVSREQEDWEVKWKSFLGSLSPLNLNLDSELGPSEALQAHCFSLAEENEDSIFHRPLVSVPDVRDSNHGKCGEKDDGALETMMDKLMPPPRCPLPPGISSVPLELSKVSENRDMLIEKSLHMQTCKGEKKPVPLKMLKNGKDKPVISEMWENAGGRVTQMEPSAKKDDLLERARDELAEEVAKRVVSESPQSTEGKEMALEDLISSLAFNPFLTRKQIPRTPENLLTEIRSSWRKAIETAGSSDIELAPTEVMVEAPMDAQTIMQKASDSRLVCSIAASAVPDLDPPLSERKLQLSSTEFRLQEQMRIIESPLLETCGMRERERTEEQELKCIVLNQSLVEDPVVQTLQYVKTNMNTPDICSESNSRTNALPSDHFWGSLKDGILHWNLSSLLSSVSHEAASLGILDETFPEELCSIDPDKSTSIDSDFDVSDSIYVTGASENRSGIKKSNLDLQSLLNRYKMLKKTASRSEEELHQTYDEGESVSCTLDLSLASEKREKDKLSNPPEVFCLDEEFTRSPSPISLNERKYSLSSLLVPYPHLDKAASIVHEIPLSFIHKLKDKELLNENPGGKESSSG
ncbi:HAUS augmin-like complex subunit 6 isoform X2 [Phalacrocorax carbo]|uniref:HAUS augmin-like complex subunit 6 isoform X2 n=1 Tax=Phalacrocorax carbo TaxID=9209 RepID=UPI003119F48C